MFWNTLFLLSFQEEIDEKMDMNLMCALGKTIVFQFRDFGLFIFHIMSSFRLVEINKYVFD